jgi:MFS family permease
MATIDTSLFNIQTNLLPQCKKICIVILLLADVLNSTLSSALPSGAVLPLSTFFSIPPDNLVLLTSIYLLGYVFGPLAFGPLSEIYGRRVVLIPTFLAFTMFTLGCALARSWGVLVGFRFLAGVAASCPIAVVGGVYADVYDDPVARGRAMAVFMAVCIVFAVCDIPAHSYRVTPLVLLWAR